MNFYMRKRGRKISSAPKRQSVTRMGLAGTPGASLLAVSDRDCGFIDADILYPTESASPFDVAELKDSKE